MPKKRWTNPHDCIGSPTGLIRLPNHERTRLYHYLKPFVGSTWAHAMRDWSPNKITQFLENSIRKEA